MSEFDKLSHPQWEYKVMTVSVGNADTNKITRSDTIRFYDDEFNKLGLLGWELVGFTAGAAVFKRLLL